MLGAARFVQGSDLPAGQLSRQLLGVEAMASNQRAIFERMAASSSSDNDSGIAKRVTASAPLFGRHVNCGLFGREEARWASMASHAHLGR